MQRKRSRNRSASSLLMQQCIARFFLSFCTCSVRHFPPLASLNPRSFAPRSPVSASSLRRRTCEWLLRMNLHVLKTMKYQGKKGSVHYYSFVSLLIFTVTIFIVERAECYVALMIQVSPLPHHGLAGSWWQNWLERPPGIRTCITGRGGRRKIQVFLCVCCFESGERNFDPNPGSLLVDIPFIFCGPRWRIHVLGKGFLCLPPQQSSIYWVFH